MFEFSRMGGMLTFFADKEEEEVARRGGNSMIEIPRKCTDDGGKFIEPERVAGEFCRGARSDCEMCNKNKRFYCC